MARSDLLPNAATTETTTAIAITPPLLMLKDEDDEPEAPAFESTAPPDPLPGSYPPSPAAAFILDAPGCHDIVEVACNMEEKGAADPCVVLGAIVVEWSLLACFCIALAVGDREAAVVGGTVMYSVTVACARACAARSGRRRLDMKARMMAGGIVRFPLLSGSTLLLEVVHDVETMRSGRIEEGTEDVEQTYSTYSLSRSAHEVHRTAPSSDGLKVYF